MFAYLANKTDPDSEFDKIIYIFITADHDDAEKKT